MSNKYKSPFSEIVGREGEMYNEATMTNPNLHFQHFGIFANDNTYAVTFNPLINRPFTKIMEHKPVRPPPTNQHITKPICEPPVSMTDSQFYLNNAKAITPPILPPYLKMPQDLARIQGLAKENNKGSIIYGPTHTVTTNNIIY